MRTPPLSPKVYFGTDARVAVSATSKEKDSWKQAKASAVISDKFDSSAGAKEQKQNVDSPENLYRASKDASSWAKSIVKAILKVTWQYGSFPDSIDGKPRVRGEAIKPMLKEMKPGDLILNGNSGGLSHLMVYTGEDEIIHSMATHNTMLGVFGSLYDNAKRLLGFGPKKEMVGVLKERLSDFLDRYERDTFVVVRDKNLTSEQIEKGLSAIRPLVGKEYDYDFSAGDQEYYCTELAVEFLKAATGEDPVFNTTHVTVPGLLSTHAIEPHHLLESDLVSPVLANPSAKDKWEDQIKDAKVVGTGS